MQPTPYVQQSDFSEYQALNTSAPFNGANLDNELVKIQTNLTGLNNNAAMIQRDDGAMRNQIVHPETLSPSVLALFLAGAVTVDPVNAFWATATVYPAYRLLVNGTTAYLSTVAHTSAAAFATDLAAAKWVALGNSAPTSPATSIDIAAGHDLVAGNLQVVLLAIIAATRGGAESYNSSYFGGL